MFGLDRDEGIELQRTSSPHPVGYALCDTELLAHFVSGFADEVGEAPVQDVAWVVRVGRGRDVDAEFEVLKVATWLDVSDFVAVLTCARQDKEGKLSINAVA